MEYAVKISSVNLLGVNGFPIDVTGEGINFQYGTCCAIIGANGSGKSTLFESLLNIRLDYDVKATVLEFDCKNIPAQEKSRIGVCPYFHEFSVGITVRDIIELHSRAYNQPENTPLIHRLKLDRIFNQLFSKTSSGQKKRISIYYSLAHEPELCIMDEPSTGLDRQGISTLASLIAERSKICKTTIVITHNPLILGHAKNVSFLTNGKIDFHGDKLDFINQRLGEYVLEIENNDLTKNIQSVIESNGLRICEDKSEVNRILIFGSEEKIRATQKKLQQEMSNFSGIRKIRDGDVFVWINRRGLDESNTAI